MLGSSSSGSYGWRCGGWGQHSPLVPSGSSESSQDPLLPPKTFRAPLPQGPPLKHQNNPRTLRSLPWDPCPCAPGPSAPRTPSPNPHSPLHDLQSSPRMLRSTLRPSFSTPGPSASPGPPSDPPQGPQIPPTTFRTPPCTLSTLPSLFFLSRTPSSILRAPRRSFRALPKDPPQDLQSPPVTLSVHPATFRAAPGRPDPHLQLLQFEAEVDEPHDRVLLPLRVFGQRQDGAAALLDGAAQLLHVGRQDQTLRRGRPRGEREENGRKVNRSPRRRRCPRPYLPHSPRAARSGPPPGPGPWAAPSPPRPPGPVRAAGPHPAGEHREAAARPRPPRRRQHRREAPGPC